MTTDYVYRSEGGVLKILWSLGQIPVQAPKVPFIITVDGERKRASQKVLTPRHGALKGVLNPNFRLFNFELKKNYIF